MEEVLGATKGRYVAPSLAIAHGCDIGGSRYGAREIREIRA
jgi:hypothetical protein